VTTAPVGCLDGEQAIRDALAAGPTPGPWFTISRGQYWHEEEADVLHGDGEDLVQAEFVKPVGDVPTTRGQMYMRDAEYIAACHPETMRALLAELDRLRSASRQEGWQLVPVEPTDAMIRAGYDAENNDGKMHLRPAWRYMLAAAPHQAQEAQGDRHGE
jgi:hypothetical protein